MLDLSTLPWPECETRARAAVANGDPIEVEVWARALEAKARAEDAEFDARARADRDRYFPEARPKQIPPTSDWLIWLILSGRGYGKRLAVSTPVPTPDGWTTMGQLRPGDRVFDADGQPTRVVWCSPVEFVPSYRVRFSDGAMLVACDEHEWVTSTGRERKAALRSSHPRVPRSQVRTTVEIAATVRCGIRGDLNHSVAVAGPLSLPDASLPVDPYILGYWLGDGASAGAEITVGEGDAVEVVGILRAAGEPVGVGRPNSRSSALTYAVGNQPRVRDRLGRNAANGSLRCRLRDVGVLGAKHIPTVYLRASVSQRLALLQGLLDADGHASIRSSTVELTLMNERLATDANELIVSLGMRATISESDAVLDGRVVGRRWRIAFSPTTQVFRLARKAARLRFDQTQRSRHGHRMIRSVEGPGPDVPMRCIAVDAPSRTYLAGRAMIPTHNSRVGAEWVVDRALAQLGTWGVVAPTFAAGRDLCFEAVGDFGKASGILSVLARRGYVDLLRNWNRSLGELKLPNGSLLKLLSADEPDRIRGWNLSGAWADEVASWRRPDAWDQLRFAVRIGAVPQIVATTTPKPVVVVRRLVADTTGEVTVTRGSTYENRANLSPAVLEAYERTYGGTRLGRQELEGELLDDVEGALWQRRWIEEYRVEGPAPAGLERIVVAVDPAVTVSETSDETGIVTVGRSGPRHCPVCGPVKAPHAFVLDDRSCRESPDGWARRAVSAYETFAADRMVAETNQGGDMVETTIRNVTPGISLKRVTAKRGKALRAQPVAACYEQGRVHHVGAFPTLEDQLVEWDPEAGGDSPDRLDALVYAVTALDMWQTTPVRTSAGQVAAAARSGLGTPGRTRRVF